MRTFSKLAGFAGALALLTGLSPAAKAEFITSISPSFEFLFSCGPSGCLPGASSPAPSTTLSGDAIFSNFQFSNGGQTFSAQIKIDNTTPQGLQTIANWRADRLTGFGFDTVPDATGVSITSLVFPSVFLETTFPNFQKVDVCTSSNQNDNNCSGGSNGGLAPAGSGSVLPSTETFILTLTGLPLGTTGIDIGTDTLGGTELFDVKFQTEPGSFEFQGGVCTPGAPGCVTNPPTAVPEPASLALLGTALVGLGLFGWRRRRTNTTEETAQS